jgi:hypothetical protein
MARQRFSAEQIVHKLREADVELSKGTAVKQVNVHRIVLTPTTP